MPEKIKDAECVAHEGRLDDIDKTVHTITGWLKSAALIASVVGTILGYMGTGINAKLNSIETLLTDSKVMLMKHDQQILSIQKDVDEINSRHRYLDQRGIIKAIK